MFIITWQHNTLLDFILIQKVLSKRLKSRALITIQYIVQMSNVALYSFFTITVVELWTLTLTVIGELRTVVNCNGRIGGFLLALILLRIQRNIRTVWTSNWSRCSSRIDSNIKTNKGLGNKSSWRNSYRTFGCYDAISYYVSYKVICLRI